MKLCFFCEAELEDEQAAHEHMEREHPLTDDDKEQARIDDEFDRIMQ